MCCSGVVGRTVRPPKWIKPQLTRLVEEAPSGESWVHEVKYDGYRMHARIAEVERARRFVASKMGAQLSSMHVTVAPPFFTAVVISVIVVLPDFQLPSNGPFSARASWQAGPDAGTPGAVQSNSTCRCKPDSDRAYNVPFWPKCEVPTKSGNVCCWG